MWFAFALLSAILYSFRGVLEKGSITRTNRYVLGLAVRLFALPFFFLPFLLNPDLFIPLGDLSADFWISVLIISIFMTPTETFFYYKALKQEEHTLALPILSLTPILTMGFGVIFFDEYPTLLGLFGVLGILLGVYSLKIGHARHGLLEPLYHLSRNRSVQFMAVVALSLGLGAILDKVGVKASNAYMFGVVNYTFITVVLFVVAWVKARRDMYQLKTHFDKLSIIGAVVAGYTLLYFQALESGNTAYVVAIRNASILMTIILGVFWLKEKDLKAKLLAGSFIFAGLVCIKVFG